MKRPERSPRRPRLGPVEGLETRALLTIAATAPLPGVNVAPNVAVAPVNLDSYFKDSQASPSFAIFDTTLGTIPVHLTPATTPATVANFLNHANRGEYTNTIVHRSVPGFIWQAGGFQLAAAQNIAAIPAGSPVRNEFGASNVRGTIAMAKLGTDPNSATTQFFFNESDSNAANLDHQNGGFTAFGNVVGSAGLAVMDAIAKVPVPSPPPLASPLDQIPLQNYTAGTTVQPSGLVLIKSVTSANELFLTSSDAPGVATASVWGSALTVTPVSAGTAHVTVVGYGSDGKTATQTFVVNVSSSQSVTPPPATPPPATIPPSLPPAGALPPVVIPTLPPPITIPMNPPVVSHPSALIPSARGGLPASVVAGRKAKIQQTVSLFDSSGTVAQMERVTLSLSTTPAGLMGDYTLASASTNVKLKAGKQARLNLSTNQVDAGVPAGTYHVLVSVSDPDGSKTTVDTGRLLNVLAPRSRPSGKK